MIELTLPSLGADMDAGTLIEWRVAPGDRVSRGQVVAVVDTSKAAIEVECWHAGTVQELLAQPGETLPVGAPIARLLEPGELPATPAPSAGAQPLPGGAPGTISSAPPAHRRVAPTARKRAAELGVDLQQVRGSGSHGAVGVEDVERVAAASAGAPTGAPPMGGVSTAALAAAHGPALATATAPRPTLATAAAAPGPDLSTAAPAPGLGTGVPGAGPAPASPSPAAVPGATATRRPVSPAARRRAGELGVALDAVTGTGPSGAVTSEDVERAARTPVALPGSGLTGPAGASLEGSEGAPRPATGAGEEPGGSQAALGKPGASTAAPSAGALPGRAADLAAPSARIPAMRRTIAAAMSRSKREIPHYYLAEEVPLRNALEWLAATNAARPITGRLLLAVLLVKAVALAARRYPEMNGFHLEGEFRPSASVHVGVAISLRQGGLVAPALHECADKPLDQLMGELADLVRRTRAGTLRSSELADPTITVTNLGEQGVGTVQGVIYPPQVALVGFGRVSERPWVEHGFIGAMPAVTATLAADHRVSDGHRGALFLADIAARLQRPETL